MPVNKDSAFDLKLPLLFFALFFLFFKLDTHPIIETTEARYVEISREIVSYGDWVLPRFNGICHLHKPPMVYWYGALFLRFFGSNEVACRVANATAAMAMVFFLYLYLYTFYCESLALLGAWVLLTGTGFLALARGFSTDMLFSLLWLICHFFLYKFSQTKKDAALFFAYLFLSLAFLTKGPVIFLLIFYFAIFALRKNSLRDYLSSTGILLFIILGCSWYLFLVWRNPEVLNYFVFHQTWERMATDVHKRTGPFYYFFLILPAVLIPYAFFFIQGLYLLIKDGTEKFSLEILWLILPFIIFSINSSKLPTYMLPLLPPAAIIIAWSVKTSIDRNKNGILSASFIFPILFALLFLIPEKALPGTVTRNFFLYLSPCLLFIIVAGITFSLKGNLKVSFFLLSLTGPVFISNVLFNMKDIAEFHDLSVKRYALVAMKKPSKKVLFYGTHNGGMPFYLKKLVPMLATARTEFFPRQKYKYMQIPEKDYFKDSKDPCFIFLKNKTLGNNQALFKDFKIILQGKKFALLER
ncbi:ArnT family glycosyltransferase [Candidatus Riflebacteria bacterium]